MEHTRLAFAHICVEVEVNGELPDVLEVMVEEGASIFVNVEYSWVPTYCHECKCWGHRNMNCRSKNPPPRPLKSS